MEISANPFYGSKLHSSHLQAFDNCLPARRLAEKGVRFIQLYHPRCFTDVHGHVVKELLA